jgi:hypothetical protein
MKRCATRHLGVGLVLWFLFLMFPRSANAAVIVVGDGTPASCIASALQDALAAAASSAPEYTNIRFECGGEPLKIDVPESRLTIPDRTTIDGDDRVTLQAGFLVEPDSSVRLVRLGLKPCCGVGATTIRNFGVLEIRGSVFNGSGAGILNRGGTVTVTDTMFVGTPVNFGSGIYGDGILRVDHSIFEGSRHDSAIGHTGVLEVKNSIFRENFGEITGGISGSGDWVIQNCEFTHNVGSFGGAISHGAGELTVKNSQFVGNRAKFGGAIRNSGSLIVNNTEFHDNDATITGGAIENRGSLLMINGTLTGNSACFAACGAGGGGIWTSTEPVLKHTTVTGNVPDDIFLKP